jgi:metallo-beta-lactamase class B
MTLLVPMVVALSLALQPNKNFPANWTKTVEPFKIVGNVYYVGTEDLASYLIATPAGSILIETGVDPNVDLVAKNIATLGFKVTDVKYLLTTQAHFDHVGGHSRMKQLSGAQVIVSEADAPVVEGGGRGDYHFGPDFYFTPVHVDRRIQDGDTVRLGGTVLTAHLTPGHTKGCTTWTLDVKDGDGKTLHVVFAGSTTVNDGVKLVDNAEYPRIADDYRRAFGVLGQLPCDVFLPAHASMLADFTDKAAAARRNATPNRFIDPAALQKFLQSSQQAFDTKLAEQQKAVRRPAGQAALRR